jgi:hypothetical protein
MNYFESALSIAERGFHVFPLRQNSKLPLIDDFPNQATRDPAKIKSWWIDSVLGFEQPYNIGISTSRFRENQALVVIDVDNKKGKRGDDEVFRLELEGNEFTKTASQMTPNGGCHFIYRADQPVKQGTNILANGIDIRSKGGYIVGPGSTLDGKRYEWIGTYSDVEPCPEWIITRCKKPTPESTREIELTEIDTDAAEDRAKCYLLNNAPVAVEGEGGDELTYKVAARVKDFGVSQERVLDLMCENWNDRCLPSWTTEELRKKVENAFRYGSRQPGINAPEKEFSKSIVNSGKKNLRFELFRNIQADLNSNHLVRGLLDNQAMSVVFGDSNSGKTFFALDLCMHVARGQNWNGMKVEHGGVVYVAAEGGSTFPKRIEAIRKHLSIDRNTDIPFALVPCTVDLASKNSDLRELVALIAEVEQKSKTPVRLVVIDTLSRALAGGNENASEDMGAFIRNVDSIREQTKSHLMVIHHTGKKSERGARGHSSLKAAADTEVLIEQGKATVLKQRDLDKGRPIGFSLKTIEIGRDENGDPITSCIVESSKVEFEKVMPKVGSKPALALAMLKKMFLSKAAPAKVEVVHWRDKFIEQYYANAAKQTKHSGFERAKARLIEMALIAEDDSHVSLL